MHDPTRHVYTHPSKVEHWRHLVEIAALLIAAAWGFYVFVYQERIKPASEAPNFQPNLSVDHAFVGRSNEMVHVKFSWKNLGTQPIQLDGFILNVFGARYATGPSQLETRENADPAAAGDAAPIMRSRSPRRVLTVLFAEFAPFTPLHGPRSFWLYPSIEGGVNRSIVVPRGMYDTVVVAVTSCVRRLDDARSMMFRPTVAPDGSFVQSSFLKAESNAKIHVLCQSSAGTNGAEFAI